LNEFRIFTEWWEFKRWFPLLKLVIWRYTGRPFLKNSTSEFSWSTVFRWCTVELRGIGIKVLLVVRVAAVQRRDDRCNVASLNVTTVRMTSYPNVPVFSFRQCKSAWIFPSGYSHPIFSNLYSLLPHLLKKLHKVVVLLIPPELLCAFWVMGILLCIYQRIKQMPLVLGILLCILSKPTHSCLYNILTHMKTKSARRQQSHRLIQNGVHFVTRTVPLKSSPKRLSEKTGEI
jgi:hypothetical protein